MSLTLIQGPAGGGKSQIAADLLAAGGIDLLADITLLWVALSGVERDAEGRYPEREDDDPALESARYMQSVLVRFALSLGANVAVTTSRRDQEERWQRAAEEADTEFEVRTVDPGEDVVRGRLTGPDGQLSAACDRAIRRWYD